MLNIFIFFFILTFIIIYFYTQKKLLSSAISMIICSLSIIVYSKIGNYEEVSVTSQFEQALSSKSDTKPLIENLEKLIEKHPHNMQWRYLLTKIYLNEENYNSAIENLYLILESKNPGSNEDQATLLIDIAQAKYFSNNKVATPEIYQLVIKSLELYPNNKIALSFAGATALQLNNKIQAREHWKILLKNEKDINKKQNIINAINNIDTP